VSSHKKIDLIFIEKITSIHKMEKTYEERLSKIKILYDNGEAHPTLKLLPKKSNIERDLNYHLLDLLDGDNLKSKLKLWRILGTDYETTDALTNDVNDKIAYLDVIEQNMAEMINDYRTKLIQEKSDINTQVVKKKLRIIKNINTEIIDTKREPKILTRLNRMPEDVVRYISEFLFTPKFRLYMLVSKYPDLKSVMAKMKVPKLKQLSAVICKQISERFARRFNRNIHIKDALPKDNCDLVMHMSIVTNPHSVARLTLRKPNKIMEIVDFIKSCEWMTNFIERFGYKKTVSRMRTDLFRMYNTILYASRREFNRNRSREAADAPPFNEGG